MPPQRKNLFCVRCELRVDDTSALCPQCGGTLRRSTEAPSPNVADEVTLELDLQKNCKICRIDLINIHDQVRGLCPEHQPKKTVETPRPQPRSIMKELPVQAPRRWVRPLAVGLTVFGVTLFVSFFDFSASPTKEKEPSPTKVPPPLVQVENHEAGISPDMAARMGQGQLSPQEAVDMVNHMLGQGATERIGERLAKPGERLDAEANSGVSMALQKGRVARENGDIQRAMGTLGAIAKDSSQAAHDWLNVLKPLGRCREATPAMASLAVGQGGQNSADYVRHLATCEGDLKKARELSQAWSALPNIPRTEKAALQTAWAETAFLEPSLAEVRKACSEVLASREDVERKNVSWHVQTRCQLLERILPTKPPTQPSSWFDLAIWHLALESRGQPLPGDKFPSWSQEGAWLDVLLTLKRGGNVSELTERVLEPLLSPKGASQETLHVPLSSFELDALTELLIPPARRPLARFFVMALLERAPVEKGCGRSAETVVLSAAMLLKEGSCPRAIECIHSLPSTAETYAVRLIRAVCDPTQHESTLRSLLERKTLRPRAYRALVEGNLVTPEDRSAMTTLIDHPDIVSALALDRR